MRLSHLLVVTFVTLSLLLGVPQASLAESSSSSSSPNQVTPLSPSALLAEADSLLSSGQFDAAAQLLGEGVTRFGAGISSVDNFTLSYALALVRVRLGEVDSAIVSFARSITLADALEASGEPGYDGVALSIRLDLAGFLQEEGRSADSESLCWDALGRTLARKDPIGLGRVVVALTLAVLSQPLDDSALRAFLAELDGELSAWDGYRLSLPPPPEPLFAWLEEGAARLLSEGNPQDASVLFAAILRLDKARSADWRIVSDLSAVAFSSLLTDDLATARTALAEVESSLRGDPVPVDVWANRCYLAAFEGEVERAGVQCLGGVEAARAEGDAGREAALTSVLAGLRRVAGEGRQAVTLYEDAAQRYDQMGAADGAATQRSEAIVSLVELRHLDEALRLLQRLDERRKGLAEHPHVEEARQRLALEMLLISFDSADSDTIRTTLQSIGAYLFETGRAVDLSELSLLYLDLVDRRVPVVEASSTEEAPEDLGDAVAAIVRLEEELGLGSVGWVGLYGSALLHFSEGEESQGIEVLEGVLGRYEESALKLAVSGDPLRVWTGRGTAPFYRRPPFEPHQLLLERLRVAGRSAEAAALEARMGRVERAILWRQPAAAGALRARNASEVTFLARRAERRALEAQLVTVSLHGGEIAPAEQRASLAPLQAQLRSKEDVAFDALSPQRKLLFRPGHPPEGSSLPGTSDPAAEEPSGPLSWFDLSSGVCVLGGPGAASISLVLSEPSAAESVPGAHGRLSPGKLSALGWSGVILVPQCESSRADSLPASLGLQDAAFFVGGASAVVRQVVPAPRRARTLFSGTLNAALQEGSSASEAFDLAMSAVRKRWRAPRLQNAWELRLP